MTSRTITADKASYAGSIAGIKFTSGTATVDDSTAAGAAVVAFAKRQGWAVAGVAAANPPTLDEGLPVPSWTIAQLKAYLDVQGVKYPSSASKQQLLDVVQTAYETRAQGGSAALPAAGHTQGTFPVLDAPNVHGDDDTEAAKWSPPVIYSPNGDGSSGTTPTITTQPTNVSGAVGAQKTITVDGAGLPEPTVQWQKAESTATTTFANVAGATSKTLNLTLATADNGDLYRAVLTNPNGSVTSNAATVTVTA